jgi:hypothetical protein
MSEPRLRFRLRPSRKGGLSGGGTGMPGMPQNFLDCDREQVFLMPPSLRDWLPEEVDSTGRRNAQR